MKKFNPLLKTKKSLSVDIASRADSGQWQFTSAKILLSTERAWNKEGVAWSQKWRNRITCPRGIRGWPAYEDRDRTRAIERWGIPQDVNAERAYINITYTLELEHNSLYLLLNTFSSRPFSTRSRANIHLWPNIANFFHFVQRSIFRIFLFFSFTNLIIYIEIWHVWDRERKEEKRVVVPLRFIIFFFLPVAVQAGTSAATTATAGMEHPGETGAASAAGAVCRRRLAAAAGSRGAAAAAAVVATTTRRPSLHRLRPSGPGGTAAPATFVFSSRSPTASSTRRTRRPWTSSCWRGGDDDGHAEIPDGGSHLRVVAYFDGTCDRQGHPCCSGQREADRLQLLSIPPGHAQIIKISFYTSNGWRVSFQYIGTSKSWWLLAY